MSAPHSMGRTRAGDGVVLSMMSGKLVLVGDGGELLDVDDVELGIAEGLGVDGAGLVVDGGAQAVEVVGIDEAHRDAEPRQRVVEEVVGAAVERGGGDDLVAGGGEGDDGEGFGGLAGGGGEAGDAAFERGDALLEDVGGGVHDAGVDVAELLQREEAGGVVGVLKKIGSGLVDGHGAGAGGGVGRLAGVDGEGGKLLRGFGHDGLLQVRCWWRRDGPLQSGRNSSHEENGPHPWKDPGRLVSRSVALSAFAVQEPHGRVRMAYTWTWPPPRGCSRSA